LAREPRRNQAPVVEKLDSAIHWIKHHPTDKCQGNLLGYPLDRDDSVIHLLNNWGQKAYESWASQSQRINM